MAKIPAVEVRILDIEEAKAIIARFRMITGYARELEQLVHSTYEGELAVKDTTPEEAINAAREAHGVASIDMEIV